MAYNRKNDTEVVLNDFEKNDRGDYVRVTRIENEDGEYSFDIRNMYTKDGVLSFTSKGVRVREDMAVDIVASIINAMSESAVDSVMQRIGTTESEDGYNEEK